ncbi:hypothetical protein DL766_002698 [Monosporascus sp. MC13-8B]|uniref:Altered inheritance of mitochondria protein 32 n=1 Tax=Monosporascus cannonballus TaxID=155416 RepID=A0ABY0H4K4_9PEZI|nr:hypothetical protein DL762_005706 [Monosporascus cannonballus]RYO89809.1 hypothetical protein DL763_005538 [Monosporascus cannonballus]RYP35036.1 hypothetical protein DL766_002698 [Monosporascus sp. MC13-8B]
MPEGLELDKEGNLNGLISNYAEQVLVCTGRDDWTSRIEDDDSGDNLAADLKELIGRGGVYSDPFHNVSVLNSSFPSSITRRPEVQTTSAYLLPSFKYVPFLPRVSFDSVQALVRGYLLPEKLHPMHDGLSPIHRDRLLRKEAYQHLLYGVQDVTDVLVLVCGHGGRDMRCGIMGPVLQKEFEAKLPQAGFDVLRGPVIDERVSAPALSGTVAESPQTARVAQISHIGGHKYAGNVIIYLPPTLKNQAGNSHPLAGHGIWYGRIEPKHVEGLIKETIVNGNFSSPSKPTQAPSQVLGSYRAPCPRSFSDSAARQSQEAQNPGGGNGARSSKRPSLLFLGGSGLCLLIGLSLFGLTGSGSDGDVINGSTFGAFTITSREQVSSTAFILAVRAAGSGSEGGGGGAAAAHQQQSARIRQAWDHGLWSVEIKQPQLQIARRYTPLPPPITAATGSGAERTSEDEELRFLIRRMDGGEMSNYLSQLDVGDRVWLRGPHLGFDVARRLGGADHVVFLAGGTGVAPALQVARRLLLAKDAGRDDHHGSSVSLLWANRRGVDALGRETKKQQQMGLFERFWRAPKATPGNGAEAEWSSFSEQIRELRRRYPDRFSVHYFVDEEGSFIGAKDIVAAMGVRRAASRLASPAKECPWHSAALLEALPNDDDTSRAPGSPCSCARTADERAGSNLLFVSGPDGFIEAYAGPKRWGEGGEMQGPVMGLVGRLVKKEGHGGGMNDWLVLKL